MDEYDRVHNDISAGMKLAYDKAQDNYPDFSKHKIMMIGFSIAVQVMVKNMPLEILPELMTKIMATHFAKELQDDRRPKT